MSGGGPRTTIGAVRSVCRLLVLLALAPVLWSCGSDSDETRSPAGTATGPTGSSEAKGASGATASGHKSGFEEAQPKRPLLPALSGEAGFDSSMVRVSFVNTSNPFGVRSAVVYFVSNGSGGGALAQVKACVRAYLAREPSAYCFAFPSERTFRFAKVRRRPPAEMLRPCWSAYWGKPKGRRPIGSASNPAFGPLHCPAG
jgi:hypothetical protein